MTWKTREEIKRGLDEILPLHFYPGVRVLMIREYKRLDGQLDYAVTVRKSGRAFSQTQTLREWRTIIANRREQYIEGPARQAKAERERLFDLMDEA